MKNKERYVKEILEAFTDGSSCVFKKKHIHGLKEDELCTHSCRTCPEEVAKWLEEEYVAKINWRKVPPGTPVKVWDTDCQKSMKGIREFCIYLPGSNHPFVVCDAGRKFSEVSYGAMTPWKNCELAPEVDPTPYLLEEDSDAED